MYDLQWTQTTIVYTQYDTQTTEDHSQNLDKNKITEGPSTCPEQMDYY